MTSHQARITLRVRWLLSIMLCPLVLGILAAGPSAVIQAEPQALGEISGRVWHDWNQNGTRDEAEPALANVLVVLSDEDGLPIANTRTDADGLYRLGDLPAGRYLLAETDPEGYASTTPNLVTLDLADGASLTQDFGDVLSLPGCFRLIDGQAWHDINGNGTIDTGEEPLEGVSLRVLDLSGTIAAISLSGASGMFTVRNLAEGQYLVMAELPAGYARATVPLHWGVDLRGCYPALIDLGFQHVLEAAWRGERTQDLACPCGDTVAPDGVADPAVQVWLNPPTGETVQVTGWRIEAGQGADLTIWDTDPTTKPSTLAVVDANGAVLNPNATYHRTVREPETLRLYLSDAAAPEFVAGTPVTVTALSTNGILWQTRFTVPAAAAETTNPTSETAGWGTSSVRGAVRSVPYAGADASQGSALAGVLVTLTDPQGRVVAEQRSQADGAFCFERLLWQHYYVVQQPLPGYSPAVSWLWGAAATDASEIVINLESIPQPGTPPKCRVYVPHVLGPPASE
ncbi:MAG: SdrD B-like domain-containing protein [Anaerolineae bacterium]